MPQQKNLSFFTFFDALGDDFAVGGKLSARLSNECKTLPNPIKKVKKISFCSECNYNTKCLPTNFAPGYHSLRTYLGSPFQLTTFTLNMDPRLIRCGDYKITKGRQRYTKSIDQVRYITGNGGIPLTQEVNKMWTNNFNDLEWFRWNSANSHQTNRSGSDGYEETQSGRTWWHPGGRI